MLFLSSKEILILTGIVFGTWLVHGYIQERRENPNNLPLPPGPKGYPIIGSLFSFPTYKAWLEYDKWFKIYGDMIYFKVFGQGFLILGSLERVYDIFERRSSNYSDRPRLVMLNELMGWDYVFVFQRYGTWWRRHRRQFHDHFHPNIVYKYQPIQIDTARAFVRNLLESPEKFRYHIRYAFADSILKTIYGMDVRENDSYIGHAKTTLEGVAEAGHPGSFLVDIFPFMKTIPEWFPGAEWKRKANVWSHINSIVANSLWNTVKEQMEAGTAKPCIATAMMESIPDDGSPESKEEEIVRRDACAVGFLGGSDTTVSTVTSFFMAMALYPNVQKKAQAELDQVLGSRLPEFNDRPSLPYINALLKECARWQLVTPLAISHMSSNADEYNGYHIPKGTYVIGNAWSILHDPKIYRDPFLFNPDRFLKNGEIDPSVRDPTVASFGFGRRICPGRFFADASLFSTVTHVLAVFDIKPSLDKNGKEIEIKPDMTNGLLSYPESFECTITPRSNETEQLIRNSGLMV
ncbi:hypothetical protein AGABI1DRAFT_77728 [Agaricus bisporus var. burnettii JB137-S8]|uniref:O-methylsterigmatocystin oxidoreductase n=1 Tax=Agaricus bisporus var. burnettii (strain JB137-S8 / ATCC MYA-4627 / FGSC 10392) TaxID=597362 RepID=K5WPK7_AGABU|nr:uncharacterized protein AGABI1DRAFT_77728 [Agaricus bisporus var. burnettii JB137-S8]EKM77276.1 hypothetical protein AGABI1DRAFT_77728 [Agaricus bisporus var. burnettii JB137-S8]